MNNPIPTVDFYRGPSVISKATEIAVLNIAHVLVRKGVLTKDEAVTALTNAKLSTSSMNAHEVTMTLTVWGRMLQWLIENDAPSASAPKGRAAA